MAKVRCAILDDYQNVALKMADWSKVSGELDIKVFNEHLGGDDKVVQALQGFQIVCAMRERTAFPAGVIEKLTAEKCKEAGVDYASKEDLFRQADFVSIHVVLSQRSRGLVGAKELSLMKPTAYIINTSRGPIIEETALLATLRDKKIAGAGL